MNQLKPPLYSNTVARYLGEREPSKITGLQISEDRTSVAIRIEYPSGRSFIRTVAGAETIERFNTELIEYGKTRIADAQRQRRYQEDALF